MKIKELKEAIQKLEECHGDIDEVCINFRRCSNSDVNPCNVLEEDLFLQDNKTLDSVCFLTEEDEDE